MIDRDRFWKIIEEARSRTSSITDIPLWLKNYLMQKPLPDILDFEKQIIRVYVDAYDARLWAAAGLMLGSCGDDTFRDFRGWLIAQGRLAYEHALKDPDSLADLDQKAGDHKRPLLFEMSYVAVGAYRDKTGQFEVPLDFSQGRNAPLLNEEFMQHDPSKLSTLFPKLYAQYDERTRMSPYKSPFET